ncbi:MAG: MMPL family transporter, partial [Solirubrobacteraceae bacterium]
MIAMTRRCMAHRRMVVVGWIAVAVLLTVIAGAVGRNYANDFSLPGTQSQRVLDLLKSHFPSQSGDVDTIVFHYAKGRFDSPQVKRVMAPLIAGVANDPHVVGVLSPYSANGTRQISADGRTAFAVVNYNKAANLVPAAAGKPILNAIGRVHVPGLQVAAGGQVIENAEGFNIGPATSVGVIAAMVILLLTFGSLIAAGLPLITAGIGLITGLALVGLSTRVFSVSNVAPELALMIGLGVGIDYALFLVTRHQEQLRNGMAMDDSIANAVATSGSAIVFAGGTVVIALLSLYVAGIPLVTALGLASASGVVMAVLGSISLLPALLGLLKHRIHWA